MKSAPSLDVRHSPGSFRQVSQFDLQSRQTGDETIMRPHARTFVPADGDVSLRHTITTRDAPVEGTALRLRTERIQFHCHRFGYGMTLRPLGALVFNLPGGAEGASPVPHWPEIAASLRSSQ